MTGDLISAQEAHELATVYLEARNTPDLALLDTIYSPDVVVHDCSAPSDIRGLEALKAFYGESHEGFPDFKLQFDRVIPAQDSVVFLWTVEATHSGDLRGLPATNRRVTFSGMAMDRIANDRIVEEWVHFNVLDLLQQLGMAIGPGHDEA